MTISNWLRKEGLTQEDFVTLSHSKNFFISKGAVSKWCNGQRIPRYKEMQQLMQVTNGEVMPNDFYTKHK